MTNQASPRGGGRLLAGIGAAALLLLGGCAVVPGDYYDVGTPVTSYPAPAYGPTYVAPAYPVYPAPYYYGPSMSLGIYGGWSDDRHHWREPPRRPGWNGHNGPRPGWSGNNGPRPGGWDRPSRPSRPDVRPPPRQPGNPDWRPGAPRNRLGGVDGGG